jgi:exonuclease III
MALFRELSIILLLWLILRGLYNTQDASSALMHPTIGLYFGTLIYPAEELAKIQQVSPYRCTRKTPSSLITPTFRARAGLILMYRSFLALLLICLSNDVQLNPGPTSSQPPNVSANGLRMPIKCITINARSLKSTHIDDTTGTTVCNLQRFQDLVYSENFDVVCVNETWLNSDFSDQEILHPGYTIYRKDRHNRSGGGVLIAIKTCSFKSVNNFEVVSDDVQHLEIVSAELKTDSNQTLLFVSCYRPPDADQSWMDGFKNFLNYTSDKYKNVILSGDLNLPHIPWNSIGNTTGAQELTFIELLDDHFLTQLITVPTRGKNTLCNYYFLLIE